MRPPPCLVLAAAWLVLGAGVESSAQVRRSEPGAPGYESSVERLRMPRLIYRERPAFPGDAARAGIREATVFVQALIRQDGSVEAYELLACSDPGFGFEREALHTIGNWRYAPAFADGRPVEVYQVVRVRFHREYPGAPAIL